MNSSDSLKRAENALRDFISYTLESEFGQDWIDKCGVSEEKLKVWSNRRDEESKKLQGRKIETRLIYFADFHDLWTILKKHWANIFSGVFGKQKTMEIFLEELGKYRNMDAHQRELLPYQKSLVIGISEEIRNKIIRFRSMKEEKSSDDYFPRIERIADNLGNVWTPKKKRAGIEVLNTNCILSVGDTLTFQISATDPYGESLMYRIKNSGSGNRSDNWKELDALEYTVSESDVGIRFYIRLEIKSKREYHANRGYDEKVTFMYQVLPPN